MIPAYLDLHDKNYEGNMAILSKTPAAAAANGNNDANAEWFPTGDRGELDKDGFLFFKGRSREMLKRGGGAGFFAGSGPGNWI